MLSRILTTVLKNKNLYPAEQPKESSNHLRVQEVNLEVSSSIEGKTSDYSASSSENDEALL